MTVVTDRAQGGASLQEGGLELMVHRWAWLGVRGPHGMLGLSRRCERDDWYGVGEALQEEAYGQGLVARGAHLLIRCSPFRQWAPGLLQGAGAGGQ